MLKQRVITALLLLAVLLPAMLHPNPLVFATLAVVLVGAAAWEWGRLNGLGVQAAGWVAAACLLLCTWYWQEGWLMGAPRLLWVVIGSSWVLASAWLLYAGVKGWLCVSRTLRWLAGVLALALAWLALAQARVLSLECLLSILSLVWVADIAAYAAGRSCGGRFFQSKLAASISPGKSWEGVLGAMLGTLVLAVSWALVAPEGHSLYANLLARHGWGVLLLSVVFLTSMSVVGDLIESLIKRAAGVKDSSHLLPGHGGVLDRIDALLPVLPLAMMLLTL